MSSRNKYFILKSTQLNLVFSFLTIAMIILVITASNIAFFVMYFKNFILTQSESIKLTVLMRAALSTFGTKLLFLFLADIIIIFIMGILISHRIAGPIFKVMKIVKFNKEGDLSQKIVLRKSDLLFELASSINEYTDSIKEKIITIKKVSSDLPDCPEKESLIKELDIFKVE